MACPQSYNSKNESESESESNHHPSELKSLLSQPSLQSVPSLTSKYSHQQQLYLSNTQHHCLTTLKGHTSYISSLALAGEFLYTGSSDREIRSWKRNPLHYSDSDHDHETPTNNLVAAGQGAVKSLVVQADKVFSAHQDHKIRVWKVNYREPDHQKYTRLATLPTLGDRAINLLMPKNQQVQIRRHKKCTWVHHVDAVSALALSGDESLLYSVSWDRTLKIWRTKDFKCLESLTNAHDDAINALALSNDGHVYTGSADKKIKVWKQNAEDRKKHFLVATLEKHNSGINALALSGDGAVLYSGACDRSILVWEKVGGARGSIMEVVGLLRGHGNSILCLAVVSDLVCSGSADRTVRVWRGFDRNYSCLAVLEGHRGPVKCLTAAVDRCGGGGGGNTTTSDEEAYLVYSGGLDCDIKVWQVLVPIL